MMTTRNKSKPYVAHEMIYRKMKENGFLAWGQKGSGSTGKSCVPETRRFLKDVLSQPWAPKSGRAVELGCGTAPILRHICKKGFSGLGIDISKTAIQMAKEQSQGLPIRFKQADACRLDTRRLGTFDLVIDGLCLHCITEAEDRTAYFDTVRGLLNEDGLFILLTMCAPVDKQLFAQLCKGQKLVRNTVYVPFSDSNYAHLATFNGKQYLPSRLIAHWKDILRELTTAGLMPKLIRYNAPNSNDFCGTLTLGAKRTTEKQAYYVRL